MLPFVPKKLYFIVLQLFIQIINQFDLAVQIQRNVFLKITVMKKENK